MADESNLGNPNTTIPELRIEVSYGELKASFSGDAETVLNSLNSFIGKQIPAIDIARKISMRFSTDELVHKFQNYIRLTPEGPRIWKGEEHLSDKEAVALQLAAQIIAYDLGKQSSQRLGSNSLQELTGLNPKTLSSRLSELQKSGLAIKETGESGPTFRITTQGIAWLSSVLSKQ